MNYPDKQTVLSVWEEGNPYSKAFSSSSFVAVTLLTGGDAGLGAETTSFSVTKQQTRWVHKHQIQQLVTTKQSVESNSDSKQAYTPLYSSLYNHKTPLTTSSA